MLVIKKRGAVRRYRYGGSGILDGFIQKMFSGGMKNLINRGIDSVVAHKVANAVVNGATLAAKKTANAAVNGATLATQKAAEKAANKVFNTVVTPYIEDKLRGKKRTASAAIPSLPAKRININSLIDGSGIVLD